MSQFLNYITKKQTGGDISSLPGVLSLSGIQDKINLDKKKAAKRDPELRQYTPKPGDLERQRKLREEYLKEENSLVNRMMANPTFNKFMDNIVSPMITMSEMYGVGALGRMGLKAVGKAGKKAVLSDPEITRGFIDWGDAVDYTNNPNFKPRLYERAFQGDYVPPTTDPKLIPRLFERKKGGPIVDSRGQWAHPGKEVIVPTENGRITMKGVPYLVYGEDENGFGQLMMPGGEYKFTGNNVYEKPIDMFNYEMAYGGQMIRRADGSYSKRGLWDNIRANKGSGKKPTKEMLEQERAIRAEEKEYGGEYEMKKGGYVVTRSNDRKGKTHKVTGPDGTVKYFGDSKLGQHPKDPERKKAFYARHKKNLERNPYFRAFARATWEEGGPVFDPKAVAASTYVAQKPKGAPKYSYPSTEEQVWNVIKNTPKLLWEKANVDMPTYIFSKMARLGEMAGLIPNPKLFPGDKNLTGAQLELQRLDDLQRERWEKIRKDEYKSGGYIGNDGRRHMSTTPTWSGNAGYEMGGYIPEFMMMGGIHPQFAPTLKKQFGGPTAGDEIEVSPEELEMLRAQGYEFEII